MDTFHCYFNIAFPVKATYVKESVVNNWITKGIIVSRNRLRLLCNIKRSTNLPMESHHVSNIIINTWAKIITNPQNRGQNNYKSSKHYREIQYQFY